MKKIKVLSWNIAGGRKVNSNVRFDYGEEDLGYFASHIKNFNPDIICLQEVHFDSKISTSEKILSLLEGYSASDFKLSPSHIDKNMSLGMSIITQTKSEFAKNFIYPYPDFDLYFSDGRVADRHDKGVQLLKYNGIFIANTQLMPIGLFGHYYNKGNGSKLAKKISNILIKNLSRPLIFCGDFGSDYDGEFYEVFGDLINGFCLKDALKGLDTRNIDSAKAKTFKTDYIFYSPEIRLEKSGVIETQTGHFLCWAEFEYNEL